MIVVQGSETRKSALHQAGRGFPGTICLNEWGHDRSSVRPVCGLSSRHQAVPRNLLRFGVVGLFLAASARCWSEHGGSGFETARSAPHGRHRAGRRLSCRISAWAWLHRPWRQAAVVLVQHRAYRSSLRGPARRQCAVPAALWRHDGFNQPDPADAADPADRDLQPCRPEPVGVSFESPEYTANADAIGVLRLLEAIRILSMEKETRFYQASTSELYGQVQEVPQKETTPFYPRSPYGVAKLYGYWITVNYREAYGMFASNGILFNHESPIRGETFVTRKITRGVARIEVGLDDAIYLGNLEAKRDWGHARDYVEGMHAILQADAPDDFVLATGETRSVREFVELAFAEVGRSIEWRGKGIEETGVDKKTGKTVVRVDPTYFRPTEVDLLVGDASKARQKLGWKPKTSFAQLVKEMVAGDLKIARQEANNGKHAV